MTATELTDDPWWADHTEVVRLVWHMAESGWDATEVARAVEKPWCYDAEHQLALNEDLS